MSKLISKRTQRILTVLVIAFSLAKWISGQNPGPYPLALKYEYYKLSNGLRVVLQPDPAQTEVAVEFWIHAGARDEEPGKFGLAHFFEHATPYGLTTDPEALVSFRSRRTNSNAQTRKDYTRYYVQVKPDGLEVALRYSADRLQGDLTTLTDAVIEGHRKNVLSEIDRQEPNSLSGATASGMREAGTFGESDPYGHSTYGTRKENEAFTKDDITRWYARYMHPENTVLFVVGRFDAESAKALIEKYFGELRKVGLRLKVEKRYFADTKGGSASISTPSPTNFLVITWKIPAYRSLDASSLQLLAEILDRKLKNSPEKPASIVETGSCDLFALFERAGEFGVYCSFSASGDRAEVETFLRQTIAKIRKNGVSATELKGANARILEETRKMENQLGFIDSRTQLLGEGLLFAGDPSFYFKRLQYQSRLKPSDVGRSVRKYLRSTEFNLFISHATTGN